MIVDVPISKLKFFDFDYARTSTILTTVNLLDAPLVMMGQGLPTILAAHASMKRIQTFLETDEKSAIAFDNTTHHGQDEQPQSPVQIQEKISELSIDNASFSWLPDSPVVLHNITCSLTPGQLHMCVGPVASVSIHEHPAALAACSTIARPYMRTAGTSLHFT